MKNKLLITGFIIFIFISILFSINYYDTKSKLNSYNKQKVINLACNYILHNSKFSSETIKDVDVKYEKGAGLYIANVSFKSNPKLLHLLISEDTMLIDEEGINFNDSSSKTIQEPTRTSTKISE